MSSHQMEHHREQALGGPIFLAAGAKRVHKLNGDRCHLRPELLTAGSQPDFLIKRNLHPGGVKTFELPEVEMLN